jgi:prepilin-type N-terminal cleavage/methylation domain-containing protein
MAFKERPSRQCGFTLYELMVGVAVLSVLASVSIPSLQENLPKYRLNGAAGTIMADMMYAKMRSATLNRQYRIIFTVGSETYAIQKGNKSRGSTSWTTEGAVKDLKASGESHYYPGIDIVAVSSNPVVIWPTGTMDVTAIKLQNEKSQTATITSTIAGQIKMQ